MFSQIYALKIIIVSFAILGIKVEMNFWKVKNFPKVAVLSKSKKAFGKFGN